MSKEARARIKINDLLREAGWRFFDDANGRANIVLENHVRISEHQMNEMGENFEQSRNGFIDFLLLDDKGFPFIVLEAKSEDKHALAGKEQARRYAQSQGCRFIILSNGNSHYLWDLQRGNPVPIRTFPSLESFEGFASFQPNPAGLAREIVAEDYIVLTQRPEYQNDPSWKRVALEEVCEIKSKVANSNLPTDAIYIGSDSIESDTGQIIKKETIGEQGIKGPVYYFEPNVVLYSKIRPNLNKVAFVDFDGYCSSDIYPLTRKENINIQFLKYFILSPTFMQSIHGYYERVGIPKLNREKLFTVEIPLPPLDIQREIVARIERERSLVEGNRELIRIYEEKIEKVIERVWES